MLASRRRCCLCLFLHGRDEVRQGQISHLNHDASDSRFDNLVFLCLEHHNEFDGRRSQSKGFLIEEVREYRDRLYKRYEQFEISDGTDSTSITELEPLDRTSEYDFVRRHFGDGLAFTQKPWRFGLWQVANQPEFFAYKSPNRADGVCLIERIDLPDGRIVIVCIETPGNPGQSITNCVEELCFQVCARFDIPADRLVWLEHYDFLSPDEWNMVTFAQYPPNGPFSDPHWTPMTPEIWQDLRLRPKRKLGRQHSSLDSKIAKLFHWPTEAIL
jgi:hypothetical protein